MSGRRVVTRATKPCPYFRKGKCAFGDKCSQSHEDLEVPFTSRPQKRTSRVSSQSNVSAGMGAQVAPNSITKHRESDNDSADAQSNAVPNESNRPNKITPCLFFQLSGSCKDEACQFAHVAEGDKDTKLPSSNSSEASREDGNRKSVCRYYTAGECRNGNDCRFIHDSLPEDSSRLISTPSSPVASKVEDTISLLDGQSQTGVDRQEPCSQNAEQQKWEEAETSSAASIPVDVGLCDTQSHQPSKDVHLERRFLSEENVVPDRSKHIQEPLMHKEAEKSRKAHIFYPYVGTVVPHWSQYADPYADNMVPFCKFHAQGVCSDGDDCRFRHSLTPQEYTLLFHDLQPNLWTLDQRASQITKAYLMQAANLNGNQTLRSEELHPPRKGLGPCIFYPSGKCRNGDECPYEHIDPPSFTQADRNATTNELDRYSNTHREEQEIRKAPLCKKFRKGWCIDGDNCPFRHESPEEQPQGTEEEPGGSYRGNRFQSRWEKVGKQGNGSYNTHTSGTKLCHYFLQGNCDRGNDCRYSHDNADPPVSNWRSTEYEGQEPSTLEPDPPVDNTWWRQPGDDDNTNGWGQSTDQWGSWTVNPQENEKGLESTLNDVSGSSVQNADSHPIDENTIPAPVDNNDNWSDSWHTKPTELRRNQVPCIFFGRGSCTKNNDCPFLHIAASNTLLNTSSFPDDGEVAVDREQVDEDVRLDMQATVGSDESGVPRIDISTANDQDILDVHAMGESGESNVLEGAIEPPTSMIFGCKAYFGADSYMNHIVTATDSRTILLSNLPMDVTPSDIETLIAPYGKSQDIMSVGEDDDSCTIQVEFEHEDQAANAALHLHQQIYDSRQLSSLLSTFPLIDMKMPLETRVVKLSWLAPALIVWVHYNSISKAKAEAEKLDGQKFADSIIRATFVKPDRKQNHSFAIKLEGLPIHTEKQSIASLCSDPTSVSMDMPSYAHTAALDVQNFVAQFGRILCFDEIPASGTIVSANPRNIAFVTFDTEDAVTRALETLSKVKLPSLGNQLIASEAVYYFKYTIPAPIFVILQPRIDELRAAFNASKEVKIRYHQDAANFAQVHVFSSVKYRESIIQSIKLVHPLLRGSVVRANNAPLWDDYFDTSSSEKAMEKVNSDAKGSFFIECDHRIREVRIYGDIPNAEATLLRVIKKVHSLQQYIDIPADILHQLMHGKLQALQDELGKNKVFLDIFTSRLVIRGDEKIVQKTRASIEEIMTDSQRRTLTDSDSVCPICRRESKEPVKLSCKHAYCKACLQYLLCTVGHPVYPSLLCIAEVSDEENCNTSRCGAHISYSVIHDILPAAEESSVLRSLFISNIRTVLKGKLFFCPTTDCETVHRAHEPGFVVTCNSCRVQICCSCQTYSHDGLTCKEYMEITQVGTDWPMNGFQHIVAPDSDSQKVQTLHA